MGVINTYFIASDDAAAASVVETGPDAAHGPVLDAVDPTVQAGTLQELLTGEPYDTITRERSWARLVSEPDHDSAWVVSLPDTFTDTLAGASDERLSEIVGPWSETEEFWGAGDPEYLLPMLRDWRALARTARERGEALYCWNSL